METSRVKSRAARAVLLAVPLLLLVGAVAAAQQYLAPQDPPADKSLQLLGNGTGSSEFGDPVALLNSGNDNLTIVNIAFDGQVLTQGLLGGTLPLNVPAPNGGPLWCYQPSNTIIFPTMGSWNMDTGGLCTPTIIAGGMTMLYIGVRFPNVENHTLVITTQVGDFIYTLVPGNFTGNIDTVNLGSEPIPG